MMKKITVTAEQLPVANLSVSSIGRVIRTPGGAVGRLVAFSAASSESIRVMLMNPEEVFIPEDQFLMAKAEGFYLDADKYLTYCTETDVIEVDAWVEINSVELPNGLCGDREDHEPHDVLGSAVGDYHCTAIQQHRLPYALTNDKTKETT